jgi:hypothetical protein
LEKIKSPGGTRGFGSSSSSKLQASAVDTKLAKNLTFLSALQEFLLKELIMRSQLSRAERAAN